MYSSVRKPGFVNSSRSDDHSRPSMCNVSCVKSCHRSWNVGFEWQAFWPQLAQNSPWSPVPQLRHSLLSITTLDIAQVLQELRDGKACHRIRPVGRHVRQRLEHEAALAETRVWNDERRRFIDHFVAIENQVEIDRSRGAGMRPRTSELLLDVEHLRQQFARGKRGRSGSRGIDHTPLRPRHVDGLGLEEARDTNVGNERREARDRVLQVLLAIADVTAEGNRDGSHVSWSRA